MKTRKKLIHLSTLVFIVLGWSCSSDDDNPPVNNPTANEISDLLITNQWRISSMMDSGQDETNDFNGYTFNFSVDGEISASNSLTTLTGVWTVTDSSSSSDDDDDLDLNISFPVPDDHDFDDLNDDWDIVSFTSTQIQLMDVSGGNGGTDTLVFVKN